MPFYTVVSMILQNAPVHMHIRNVACMLDNSSCIDTSREVIYRYSVTTHSSLLSTVI